jgi:ArpU family phage transcriptional regulator
MGIEQMVFPWEIDREATRQRVEEHLETARVYRQIGFVRREMKVTTSPEPRYHGPTNAVGKPTEDVAAWNVDTEERMKEITEKVQKAVSRLGKLERQIIEMRYLEGEDVYDYNVYSELHMSERKYYRLKSKAIYKLAFMLRLEVFVEPEAERTA